MTSAERHGTVPEVDAQGVEIPTGANRCPNEADAPFLDPRDTDWSASAGRSVGMISHVPGENCGRSQAQTIQRPSPDRLVSNARRCSTESTASRSIDAAYTVNPVPSAVL